MKKYIKSFKELLEVSQDDNLCLMFTPPQMFNSFGDIKGCIFTESYNIDKIVEIEEKIARKQYWYEKEEYENMSFEECLEKISKCPYIKHKIDNNSKTAHIVTLIRYCMKKIEARSWRKNWSLSTNDLAESFLWTNDLKEWHEFKKLVK